MANILLSGGRAPATLELARAFQRAGHGVYVAESFRGHICESSRAVTQSFLVPPPRQNARGFIHALKQIITEKHIDLLVPTCEETFHVAMGKEDLPCAVFSAHIDKLNELHNKVLFAERAASLQLSVPGTRLITRDADLEQAFSDWHSVVLKPVYSRFAAHTRLRPSMAEARAAIAAQPQTQWLAQAYVEGRQICTYSVCHRGRIAAHTAYPTTFTAGQGATILFEHIEHRKTLEWVRRFVECMDFTGQIAFDFIETGGGEVVALECNPRATSGVHLLAACPEFARAFFDTSISELMPAPNGKAVMLASAMLVYGLPASWRERRVGKWFTSFVSSRDVLFSAKDPLPAFLQLQGILHYVALAHERRISALEASTYDIEWNGEKEATA